MIGSIKVCACTVVQKNVRLPKPIRGDSDVLRYLNCSKIVKYYSSTNFVETQFDVTICRNIARIANAVQCHS